MAPPTVPSPSGKGLLSRTKALAEGTLGVMGSAGMLGQSPPRKWLCGERAGPGDGLLCPAAQGDVLDTAGARALDPAPWLCRSSLAGHCVTSVYFPGPRLQAPGTARSSSQLPTTLSSWTFPKSGLTTAFPCPTAFHGSPWPSGRSLSAVSVKETTYSHLPCSSSHPDHFHFLLREGLGL